MTRTDLTGWAMITPAFLMLGAFLFLPSIATFVIALTDWQFGAPGFNWIWFGNFVELAHDPIFWKAFGNTLLYVGTVVPLSLALGLGLAVLIEADPQWRGVYRAVFFLPVASTLVAMAIVWQFMLHPTSGLINRLLGQFGIEPINWLGQGKTAMWAICGIGVWEMTGLALVLFTAGLTAIPRDLYDAGAVDGLDHPLERLWRITLPMLGPTSFFVTTYCAIRAFQLFDTVQVLTDGGPRKSTEVMLHLIYAEGFSFFRAGFASALVVVYLALLAAITLVQGRVAERRVHY